MWMLWAIAAPFVAVPYALFSSVVIASQRNVWFPTRPHRFFAWLRSTFASWIVATLGGAAAGTLYFGLVDASEDLGLAIFFSTPLVAVVAHMMWLHSRRPR